MNHPKLKAVMCIQCVDKVTGKIGDFLRRPDNDQTVTPVFAGLVDAFAWLDANGWVRLPYDSKYPTGLYERPTQDGDVICLEHGRKLGDEDLIDAIINLHSKTEPEWDDRHGMTRADWDALPKGEQHGEQIGFVAPMPMFASAEE